jgi:protein-disulfide isomerase
MPEKAIELAGVRRYSVVQQVIWFSVRFIHGMFISVVAVMSTATIGTAQTVTAAPVSERLAEVNGETITAKDVETNIAAKLSQLNEQIYNLQRQELESLIAQRLLAQEAAKRGMSVSALLDAEVTAKVGLVTEHEVEAFYQANKSRMRGDETTARQNIRTHLQQQKLAAERARFVQALRSRSKVLVHLAPPPVFRANVSTDGAPVRGAADAAVTLVEFSDFHCPFCKRAQGTIKQILDKYPSKVRHVFRDFPVDGLHPQARQAAEAARCAKDQGKFWEYHDALFAGPPSAAPGDLRRYAEQTGLNVASFEQCVSSGAHRSAVQRDYEDGAKLGISGTPAFFINGRLVSGAQPLEAFVRVIEEELSRQ